MSRYRRSCPGCGTRRLLLPGPAGRCCIDRRDGDRQLTLIPVGLTSPTGTLDDLDWTTGERRLAAGHAAPAGGPWAPLCSCGRPWPGRTGCLRCGWEVAA